ncbi:hypothetical protein HDU93_004878 [Gonapodya sp. JEL0774]|nr:hypothetical protein HDU93_004878 [Gonapodya sp. JEL0774]
MDSLGLLTDELGLLEKMQATRLTEVDGATNARQSDARDRDRIRRTNDGRSDWTLDIASSRGAGPASGPLLSADGKPLRPFVITSERERFREGVFRPSHALPTMSIEEYLEIEKQRGNMLSGGGEVPEKEAIDDNDEAALDAETMRQRAFDDYKDSVRRGSGNRYRQG